VLCAPDTYANHPEQAFWRVKGFSRLKPRQLAVLRELAAWREIEAQHRDIPRRRLLQDEPMLTLARKTDLQEEQLMHIRGLSNGTAKRFGANLIAAWRRGHDCPKTDWPHLPTQPNHSEGTEMRMELLMTLVRLRAEEVEIAPNILASRSDVAALASWANHGSNTDWSELPDNPCLRGWRRKLVGDDLISMLQGRLCLRLDATTRMPVVDNPTGPTCGHHL